MKPSNIIDLNDRKAVEDFVNRFDYIICDCDGVLWIDKDVIPGAPQTLNKLRSLGKKIIFATNNSTKTREEFLNKLKTFGFVANLKELFPSSYTTAIYLQMIKFSGKVYILGSSGIAKELAKVHIESFGVGPDETPSNWSPGMADFDLDPNVKAVAVGFDNQLSFPKLAKACSYVKNPKCLFIATNRDETYPSSKPEVVVPGPGALVSAIETVTGRESISLGKPGTFFFDCIRYIHPEIDPKRTVMIGDRLTTDMVFGHNNGLKTFHVQTGIGTFEEMIDFARSDKSEDQLCVPEYYAKSLAQILPFL
ncbi:Phosphoglycolate phosphatase-like protein [Dinothrombium tinctorium]|uniref:Phosphoglycolate phosphatase-like protein n=1 Tax=Dinothrombium tinctorium TaxID=1965070 RepID=A0A3S3S0G3_9ACAR|nr:Phosphoglycolate phosphatase-like protein [Dinothrombium tinctorium]RWS04349.1 Phosphoglycolate phosphatase-like protein [Dinothrombium tinctorium]RWS07456.1 Phosphoglycolate phosphatase-like protein [Dinothrombium tinctorium]